MRRWIIFGLVIMLAFIVAANLTGPRAWASDSHQAQMTVPTRTPKPPDTPVPPTSKPPKEPTDTLVPAPTNAPPTAQPTNTLSAPTSTRTATPQVTNTATATAEAVESTLTPTIAAIDQAIATATSETTATPETLPAAAVLATPTSVAPTLDGGANIEPAITAVSAAEQPTDSTPANNSSSLWLLILAGVLVIFGIVLLVGRRRSQDSTK